MADESGGKRPELLESLKTKVGGNIAAQRAFSSSLEHRNPKPETSRLKDHEGIEEAKYYPRVPLPPVDEGELPDSYGQPKVTLMVVDPYLVYAYWDVDLTKLPPQSSSAVLRFHDASEASLPCSFEVDVDLRARNWYVHLWSPAKSYYADLGVKTTDSGFTSLARSNRIQTPRAWPVAEVDRPAIPAATASPVFAEPLSRKAAEHARIEVPLRRDEIPAAAVSASTITPQPYVPKPVDAAEVLQKKLSEIYSLRQRRPPAAAAVTTQYDAPSLSPNQRASRQGAVEPFTPRHTSPLPAPQTATPFDLTALAEHQFSPGLSSAFSASQTPERPPD